MACWRDGGSGDHASATMAEGFVAKCLAMISGPVGSTRIASEGQTGCGTQGEGRDSWVWLSPHLTVTTCRKGGPLFQFAGDATDMDRCTQGLLGLDSILFPALGSTGLLTL